MSYQTILFEVSDGIARLTLDRPDRKCRSRHFSPAIHGPCT